VSRSFHSDWAYAVQLYLKTKMSFREVADLVASRALPGFELQERDGLNLGGGDYYLFKSGGTEVILVSNDADHAEVFVPRRKAFRYYCYMHRGPEDTLVCMLGSLGSALDAELADDA